MSMQNTRDIKKLFRQTGEMKAEIDALKQAGFIIDGVIIPIHILDNAREMGDIYDKRTGAHKFLSAYAAERTKLAS